jgi:hypothetical protein
MAWQEESVIMFGLSIDPAEIWIHLLAVLKVFEEVRRGQRIPLGGREYWRRAEGRRSDGVRR